MLRLIFNRDAVVDPDSGFMPDGTVPSAALVDDEGNIAARGHIIAAADTNLGDQQMIVGLQFSGEGTLGRQP